MDIKSKNIFLAGTNGICSPNVYQPLVTYGNFKTGKAMVPLEVGFCFDYTLVFLSICSLSYSILTSFACNWIILQVATGDGMAMAHRAQAVISNME